MRAISLFSGIGGIDLALTYAGFDIIAQVEIDEYCREVLQYHAKRYWPNATQFTDVRDFGRGSVSGDIDLIAGGFPCQPFSTAGSRQGKSDNRNLWPEFRRIIGEFRPHAVLLENVPAICAAYTDADGQRQPAYALTVIGDLSQMGYSASWGIVSAADAGAGHRRDRWLCVAFSHNARFGEGQTYQSRQNTRNQKRHGANEESRRNHEQSGSGETSSDVADADGKRQLQPAGRIREERGWIGDEGEEMGNAPITRLEGQNRRKLREQRSANTGKGQLAQPRMGNVPDGLPGWLARHRKPAPPGAPQFAWEPPRTVAKKGTNHKQKIQALGNAVFVPTVYAIAIEIRNALD